jgi:capsular polysaccharide biosynthesis protein
VYYPEFAQDPFSRQLWIDRFERVTITPRRSTPSPPGFQVAVYDESGALLPQFELRRHRRPAPSASFKRAWRRRIEGPVLYGGVLLSAYGHFLIESLGRAWAIRQFPDLPFVWQADRGTTGLLPWQREILELLGIAPSRAVLVNRARRLGSVLLPTAGAILDEYFHPAQLEALACVDFREPVKGVRIWLSRTGLSGGAGRLIDEAEIENRLRALGWRVIHPETMTVREQLASMAEAEIVGGCVGSAFHTLMLARNVRARIRMLNRFPSDLPRAYEIIAAIRGFDQRIIDLPLEVVDPGWRPAQATTRIDEGAIDDAIAALHG